MRRAFWILVMTVVVGAMMMVSAVREAPVHPRIQVLQWINAVQVFPAAVAQQPRETPPNVVPPPDRAREEGGWVGWALLTGIPALIIAWVIARRRRMRRRGRDADE